MLKIEDDMILQYIEERLNQEIDLKEMATYFGYSLDHFRHLFFTYYDVSIGNYIRRRRLLEAAKKLQAGETIMDTALSLEFETPTGFTKAFRKEFGFPPQDLKKKILLLEDVIPNPKYDKNRITISYVETSELKMIGKPLLPEDCHDFDRLEEAAYWLDHDMPLITEEEMAQLKPYKDDHIAMWYHAVENTDITYLLGPVVKKITTVPKGMISVVIPGRRYAVFEMKPNSRGEDLAEDVRQLCKYIFWEWVPANGAITDKMGFTFERYQGKKAAVYLPIIPEK